MVKTTQGKSWSIFTKKNPMPTGAIIGRPVRAEVWWGFGYRVHDSACRYRVVDGSAFIF